MPDTLNQPYLFALYFAGGLLAYGVYEALSLLKKLFKGKAAFAAVDFFSVVSAGGIFLTVAHFFHNGTVAFFAIAVFLFGVVAGRVLSARIGKA